MTAISSLFISSPVAKKGNKLYDAAFNHLMGSRLSIKVFFLGLVMLLGLMVCQPTAVQAQMALDIPDAVVFADQVLTLSKADKDSINKWSAVLLRNNRYLRNYLDRADAYMPIIERIFTEENVPLDLKYIVLVESSLVSDLVSTSNAVGYWQFKYATAKDWKLRCDSIVDQRMNIVASSRAAARFLANNNRVLNNWIYTVISYYQGLTGAKMLFGEGLIGVKEFPLNQLNHKYAYKVLAHKLVFQDLLYRNGIPLLQVAEYEEAEGRAMADIAAQAGVTLDELKFFNKWLRADTVPTDRDYTVILPYRSENKNLVLAMVEKPVIGLTENLEPYEGKKVFFNLITIKDPALDTAGKTAEYKSTVPLFFTWNGLKAIMARPGDNINKLALAGGIDRDDFLEYNDMKVYDLISVGQVYYLENKKRKAKIPFHIVRDGETMWNIAQNYGIKLKHLLRKNRMEQAEKLKAGRVIWLRKDRPESTPVEYKEVPKEETLAKEIRPVPVQQPTAVPRPKPTNRAIRPETQTETVAVNSADTPTVKPVSPVQTPKVEPKADLKPQLKPEAKPVQKPEEPVDTKAAEPEPAQVVSPYANLQPASVEQEAEEDSILTTQNEMVNQDEPSKQQGHLSDRQAISQPPTSQPDASVPAKPVTKPVLQTIPLDTTQPGAKLPPVPKYQTYTLMPGETLFMVAEKLDVPLDSIIGWNMVDDKTILKPGVGIRFRPAIDLRFEEEARQRAAIKKAQDQPKPAVAPVSAKPDVPLVPEQRPEKVKDNTTPAPVKEAKPTEVPGVDKAPVKLVDQPKVQESTTKYHTVQPGETLFRISKQYGLPVQQLLDLNKKKTNTISPGEQLIVKP